MKLILLKERFTDAPWSTPRSDLDVGAYCSVCLIDYNPKGEEKTKERCKLPIRSRPGAPINKGALRNASARFGKMKGVPAEVKARAKAKLERLKKQAGIGED